MAKAKSKDLVIVESPAKARTIGRILGDEYQVMASMGHIRDLPEKQLGLRMNGDFEPVYELVPARRRVVEGLVRAARRAAYVYLATDPDREGEAIAWHLVEVLRPHMEDAAFRRVTFHEITRPAVQAAFERCHDVDMDLVNAQRARRVLDRLVGYRVSPLLWNRVPQATSAGRVQSVALRLVCDREAAITAFKPEEYWNFAATFRAGERKATFKAGLYRIDKEPVKVGDGDTARALAADAEQGRYVVQRVTETHRQRRPGPPFITSTLQQAASTNLKFNPERAMRLAQQLYEGVDTAPERGGLITYMRTDSVNVAAEAATAAREFVAETYGDEYVPAKPNRFRSKRLAQEAHEAIRPTNVSLTPPEAAGFLSGPQARLYRLIWNRFIASQMAPARQLQVAVELDSEPESTDHAYCFRAVSLKTLFPGFMKVYDLREVEDDGDGDGPSASELLPELNQGEHCPLTGLDKEQKFTEPPPRFSQASLIRELESNGVGRPSTYASIVNTIQRRSYVETEKGRLRPTELGVSVNGFLVGSLPRLLQVDFTAQMEQELDTVESGETGWQEMLRAFHDQFSAWLYDAKFGSGPEVDVARRFIFVFPEEMTWQKPQRMGGRRYDDQRFFASLQTQLQEGRKLSEKQWRALMNLAVRYQDQLPQLDAVVAELGLEEDLEALRREAREREAQAAAPDARASQLCEALASVSEWDAPSRKGRRVFDDSQFYASLKSQLEAGRRLSEAQQRALENLAVKYREQISDFATLSRDLGLPDPQALSNQEQRIRALLDLGGEIASWEPPRGKGRRRFSDEDFFKSLAGQFAEKHQLSDRQQKALAQLVAKYHAQIPDFESRTASLDMPALAEAKGVKTDVVCPKCGEGKLVRRRARRSQFYGCERYPKCDYTARSLDDLRAAGSGD